MSLRGYGISYDKGPYKTLQNGELVYINPSELKKLARDNKQMLRWLKQYQASKFK